jgi:hypothetical protein
MESVEEAEESVQRGRIIRAQAGKIQRFACNLLNNKKFSCYQASAPSGLSKPVKRRGGPGCAPKSLIVCVVN